ncbi:MAG: electron transfer flavoprotein subunit alpha/FixB family protein [Anaerovoracaceae bacterium]|jgi:electron transfer flavoprotein alpha subunit
MSQDIYVVAEQRDGIILPVSLELIGEAVRLAADLEQKVVGVLLGDKIADSAKTLIEYGADEVVYVDDPMLAEYVTTPYAKALTEVIRQCDPEIVLFGATSIGRDLAPRVASRVHTGLTADCTKLDIDEFKDKNQETSQKLLFMTRPAFGGNIMATILCKKYRPQMATVRPGVMKRLKRDRDRIGSVNEIKVDFKPSDMDVVIREVVKEKHKTADITEAKILVSGGRGIGSPEFFGTLKGVADLLGGDVSSSRANVDAGWAEKSKQVGQTGKTVRPDLYLACGISGAIQHLVGMEGSEYIIAINKSEAASIFDVADLGIVGDVRSILPKLEEALKKHKEDAISLKE